MWGWGEGGDMLTYIFTSDTTSTVTLERPRLVKPLESIPL